MKPRIILIGNNTIAVNCLEYLTTQEIEILAVLPELSDSGVDSWQKSLKLAAQNFGLNVVQPLSLRDKKFLLMLEEWSPEFIFSIQCRRILKPELIHIPKYGVINLHFAFLPKYRGCYPIAWALINGEKEAGVTLHYIDEGIDTGDIIAQKKVKIESTENARQLFDKCTDAGLNLFKKEIGTILKKKNKCIPQENSKAVYYSISSLDFKHKQISWDKHFISLYNWIRAFIFPPFQYPHTFFGDVCVEIVSLYSFNNLYVGEPREIVQVNNSSITVSALEGNIVIKELKVNNTIFSSGEFCDKFKLKKGDFFR